MEQEESEDALVILKKNLEELLETMILMGVKTEQKSKSILKEIKSDDNNLEAAGLRLIKLCICMKGNLENIVNSLQKNLNKVNKNSAENLFKEIHSKILEYKTSVFVTSENNECVQTSLLSKSTQTDLFGDSVLNNSIQLKTEKDSEIDTGEPTENSPQQLISNNENNNLMTLREFKDKHKQSLSLSLKKTETQECETQDTQDGSWIDSLKRDPSAKDLWDTQYNGDKISASDEFLDQLKREQEEEDELCPKQEDEDQWERKTEDLNYDVNQALSGSDDGFEDKDVEIDKKEDEVEETPENHNAQDISPQNSRKPQKNRTYDLRHEKQVLEGTIISKDEDMSNSNDNFDIHQEAMDSEVGVSQSLKAELFDSVLEFNDDLKELTSNSDNYDAIVARYNTSKVFAGSQSVSWGISTGKIISEKERNLYSRYLSPKLSTMINAICKISESTSISMEEDKSKVNESMDQFPQEALDSIVGLSQPLNAGSFVPVSNCIDNLNRVGSNSDNCDTIIARFGTIMSKGQSSIETISDIRPWTRKTACPYCFVEVTHFPRHLKRKHKEETAVKDLLNMNQNDPKRQDLLKAIRRQGNFFLTSKTKNLRPVRRPRNDIQDIEDGRSTYVVCQHCLGYFKRHFLRRHIKTCSLRPSNKELSNRENHLSSSQMFTICNGVYSEFYSLLRLKDEVFKIMREDEISRIAMGDILICSYAESLLRKHKRIQTRTIISNKMRELGRLLLILKEMTDVNCLFDALKPECFDNIIAATKIISGYNHETRTFQARSLALHMGTTLKQVCDIANKLVAQKNRFLSCNDPQKQLQEIKSIKILIANHWNSEIASLALKDLNAKHWDKPKLVPLTSDIIKFNEYLLKQAKESSTNIENRQNISSEYRLLTESILALTLLINQKCIGEVQYLKVDTYNTNFSANQLTEILETLSESEKLLTKNFKCVVTGSKGSRPVAILFPTNIQTFIDIMLTVRHECIPETNTYLFANPTTEDKWLSGYHTLKKLAAKAGLPNEKLFTSTRLRKQIGTILQVINMTDIEMEQLAAFMGHAKKTHEMYYRLPQDVYQTAKVSKLLLAINNGKEEQYKGKSLEEIEFSDNIDSDTESEQDITPSTSSNTRLKKQLKNTANENENNIDCESDSSDSESKEDDSSVINENKEECKLPDLDVVLDLASNLHSKSSDGEKDISENENNKVVSSKTENISSICLEIDNAVEKIYSSKISERENDKINEVIVESNNLEADLSTLNDKHKRNTSEEIPSHALDMLSANDETGQLSETSKIDEIENSNVCVEAGTLELNTFANKPACKDIDSQTESESGNTGLDIDEQRDSSSENSYKNPYSVETVKHGYDTEESQRSDNSDCDLNKTTQDISTNLAQTEKEINSEQITEETCNNLEKGNSDKIISNSITSLDHVTESQESTKNAKDLEMDVDNIQISAKFDKVPVQSKIIESIVEESLSSQCSEKSTLDVSEDNSNIDKYLTNMTNEQSDFNDSQKLHIQGTKLSILKDDLLSPSEKNILDSNKEATSECDKSRGAAILASGVENNSCSSLDLGLNVSDMHLEVTHSQEEKLNTIFDACEHLIKEKELGASDNIYSDSDATDIDNSKPNESIEKEPITDKVGSDSDDTDIDLDNLNKEKEVSRDKIYSDSTETSIDESELSKVCVAINPIVDQSKNNESVTMTRKPELLEEVDLEMHSDSTNANVDEGESSKVCTIINPVVNNSENSETLSQAQKPELLEKDNLEDEVHSDSTDMYVDGGEPSKMNTLINPLVDNSENNEASQTKKPESLEEDGLSQTSCKSFEFDISENFNHIGTNISDQLRDYNVDQLSNEDKNNALNSKEVPLSSNDIINRNNNLDVIDSPTNCNGGTIIENKQFEDCHRETGIISDSSDNTNIIDDSTDCTLSPLEDYTIDESELNEINMKTLASPGSGEPISELNKDPENIVESELHKSNTKTPTSPSSGASISELNKDPENIAEATEENKCDQVDNIVEVLEGLLSDNKEKDKLGYAKETVEILSDSDDDVHLDVTMEEILSDSASITGNMSEIEEVVPIEIKEEKMSVNTTDCTEVEESNNEKSNEHCISDELLELLKEVPVSASTLVSAPETNTNQHHISDNKNEVQEADIIFKQLEEEDSLDITDSDLSDDDIDSNLSDLGLLQSSNNKQANVENNDKLPEFEDELLLERYNLKRCYVKLERLELDDDNFKKLNKSLSDSIDRLCDLSTLIYKRKYTDDELQDKLKLKRKKKGHRNKGTSESGESYSEFSSSDSDNEQREETYSPILSVPMEHRLDYMLANEICNVLKSDVSDSTDNDSDESAKNPKNSKIGDNIADAKNTAQLKKKLSREERLKKSWRNDPLLRGKLTTDSESSDSTTDSGKSPKRKSFRKNKYQHDSDYVLKSDSTSSDKDLSDSPAKNILNLGEKVISPIKRNIPISDSSDTDSEIEFIPQQQKTPEKTSEGDEVGPSSQKGRRNIRALMSDENLAVATQRANLEEQLRIQRLQERDKAKESLSLSQSLSEVLEEEDLVLDFDETSGQTLVKVHSELTKRLKPHQKIGIQFMWDSCYESLERLKHDDGSGCILAHCMGLGKTLQVLTLIHTLFSHEATNTKRVLVVCPLSTVNNWKKEVKIAFKDVPYEKISVLTIADKKETSNKYEIVKKWYLRKKCVLVLGYEGFETLTNEAKLEKAGQYHKERMLEALVDPGPDLVICDEGHLLRNKKALKTMALNRIRTKRRIVLTGTPLQNNLLEYYHMVQFVKPNLLGNMQEYKTNFVNPITNGQYEDSTEEDIKLMMKRTHVLHKLLKKTIQRVEDTELKIYLPKMKDHAVFIQLHQVQVELYNKFSEIAGRNNASANNKGFLSDFSIFQYIGTHPHLLAVMDKMRNKKIKERDLITNEEDNPICNIDGWWKAIMPEDAAQQIRYGNKLVVLKAIIEECEEINDKVLVFSQSLGELDLIEHFLKEVGTAKCPSWQKKVDYYRMDGTVNPEQRTAVCDSFNNKDNTKLRLLLMSTKVGGLGLNLTAANRVIIMTVNWNPSYDTQSVFRVYRFGQEKPVFVYRFISLDTMEEKVYQRTVTKLAIAHRVVDKHQVTRHYKSIDLQELYSCKPNADEERPIPNVPEDQLLAKLLLKLPFIFKYHEHQALLVNRPEDNLNETELNAAWDEFKRIKDAPKAPPQPGLPQLTNPDGPTFNLAYALTRPNILSTTNAQGIAAQGRGNEEALLQYYIPNQNTSNAHLTKTDLQQNAKNGVKTNTGVANTVKKLPNSNSENVIKINDNGTSGLIPLVQTQSNKEQDPLYIPNPLNAAKLDHSYNQVLTSHLTKKNLRIPKLPLSTSISLENNSSKESNQKENLSHRNTVRKENLPKIYPILIVDDDNEVNKSKRNEDSILKGYSKLIPTANENNRKRKIEKSVNGHKELVIKKMRDTFNTSSSQPTSINLDDDDCAITDTASETGSLSNEMIKNLGLSGITIHKVMKECNRNNEVITLD